MKSQFFLIRSKISKHVNRMLSRYAAIVDFFCYRSMLRIYSNSFGFAIQINLIQSLVNERYQHLNYLSFIQSLYRFIWNIPKLRHLKSVNQLNLPQSWCFYWYLSWFTVNWVEWASNPNDQFLLKYVPVWCFQKNQQRIVMTWKIFSHFFFRFVLKNSE